MKLYTVMYEGRHIAAAEGSGGVMCSLENTVKDMNELITGHFYPDRIITSDEVIPEGKYEIRSPIPVPLQDILCIAKNYYDPGEERSVPADEAVYFSKRVSYANYDSGIIPAYDISEALDYETELGVILADDVKGLTPQEVKSHIFGYTIVNDISDRIIQKAHRQWYFGKSLDGYTSIGPCIVTADEFSENENFHIMTYVNGELRQDGTTSDMIRSAEMIVSELSQYMTLRAGTIIATGTPWGSGKDMMPPLYLKEGDIIESIIEGIGILRNRVGK